MMAFLMRRASHFCSRLFRPAVGLSVVAYLVFALLSPMVLALQDNSAIPVCCRRAGLHHCVEMAVTIGKAPAVSSGQHCPQWPRMIAANHAPVFAMTAGLRAGVGLAPQDSIAIRNAEVTRIARERQLALRGPPISSLA
jgi:hypothetical protein